MENIFRALLNILFTYVFVIILVNYLIYPLELSWVFDKWWIYIPVIILWVLITVASHLITRILVRKGYL